MIERGHLGCWDCSLSCSEWWLHRHIHRCQAVCHPGVDVHGCAELSLEVSRLNGFVPDLPHQTPGCVRGLGTRVSLPQECRCIAGRRPVSQALRTVTRGLLSSPRSTPDPVSRSGWDTRRCPSAGHWGVRLVGGLAPVPAGRTLCGRLALAPPKAAATDGRCFSARLQKLNPKTNRFHFSKP